MVVFMFIVWFCGYQNVKHDAYSPYLAPDPIQLTFYIFPAVFCHPFSAKSPFGQKSIDGFALSTCLM